MCWFRGTIGKVEYGPDSWKQCRFLFWELIPAYKEQLPTLSKDDQPEEINSTKPTRACLAIGTLGTWYDPTKKCARGTRICGLQTLKEGTDTELQGLWFHCCALIKEVHYRNRIEMTDGTFRKLKDFGGGVTQEAIEFSKTCVKYSVEACEAAVDGLGLVKGGKGHKFAASSYSTKGCYAYKSGTYAGYAFYGSGGTDSQMEETPNSKADWYRPDGYDCQ